MSRQSATRNEGPGREAGALSVLGVTARDGARIMGISVGLGSGLLAAGDWLRDRVRRVMVGRAG